MEESVRRLSQKGALSGRRGGSQRGRDTVALAIRTEIKEGRGSRAGGVWLDLTRLPRETILARLARVHRAVLDVQYLDISRDPVEVAPTAQYSMGAGRGPQHRGRWAVRGRGGGRRGSAGGGLPDPTPRPRPDRRPCRSGVLGAPDRSAVFPGHGARR
ncbi:hypothetical protein [Streptomyces acidiscabies]|uniref:hypothetical protein n=1 Tax=Streptomyces acidiscabies TaxID=42234 RepID=UPI0018FE05D7|nr:hypothetical protein [Streptomyces acidiscabies]